MKPKFPKKPRVENRLNPEEACEDAPIKIS
jgi:hypothetical protein